MIAGGNLWLHFDACSHLFYGSLTADVIARTACMKRSAEFIGYCNSYFFFLGASTMII
jgi:hypothetical protein